MQPDAAPAAPGDNAYVTLRRPESVDPGRCLALYPSRGAGRAGGAPYRQCARRTLVTFCDRCDARSSLGDPDVHIAVPARLPGDRSVVRAWLVLRVAEAVRLGLQPDELVVDAPAAQYFGADSAELPPEDEDYDDGPEVLPGPRRAPSGPPRAPSGPPRAPCLSGSWFVDRYLNSLP